jgi:hypothetical protein
MRASSSTKTHPCQGRPWRGRSCRSVCALRRPGRATPPSRTRPAARLWGRGRRRGHGRRRRTRLRPAGEREGPWPQRGRKGGTRLAGTMGSGASGRASQRRIVAATSESRVSADASVAASAGVAAQGVDAKDPIQQVRPRAPAPAVGSRAALAGGLGRRSGCRRARSRRAAGAGRPRRARRRGLRGPLRQEFRLTRHDGDGSVIGWAVRLELDTPELAAITADLNGVTHGFIPTRARGARRTPAQCEGGRRARTPRRTADGPLDI